MKAKKITDGEYLYNTSIGDIIIYRSPGSKNWRWKFKNRTVSVGPFKTKALAYQDLLFVLGIQENPNGGTMAKVSRKKTVRASRKKAASPKRAKKTAARRTTKKRVVRRVSRSVTKKAAVKRNPVKTRYHIKLGKRYFDGAGFSSSAANAAFFNSAKQAAKVALKLANATGKSVSVHSNASVKKK